MTALTDIQKALNTIRRITQQEAEAVRLEALALMAGVIADEAKDIEKRREPKPQRTAPQKIKSPPIPSAAPLQTQPEKLPPTQPTQPEVQDFAPQKSIAPQ